MYQNQRRYQPKTQYGRSRPSRFTRKPQLDASQLIKKANAVTQAPYVAQHTFADFSLSADLQQNITARGYQIPTPIQDQAIPEIIKGNDVIGIAQTGTGKTAAFLLPLLQKVYTDKSQKVLIIVPTRELAVQIDDEFRGFARNLRIFSSLCIGGVPIGKQIFSLRRGPQFVIGTPGRLKDLEKQRILQFSQYKTIVLDEVDRMLDMGFIGDIKYIIAQLPQPRHSLFFSATLPSAVREIMDPFVRNPVTIAIKAQQSCDRVNQDVIRTNGKPKIDVLHNLLISEGFHKVLLFGRTKWGIEKLSQELLKRGFKVAAIHGNKRQAQRQRALDEFKSSHIQVLLATDIASRGIDVSDVTHVINYDMPESYEDYIHRIGRTGRANAFGSALTFVD